MANSVLLDTYGPDWPLGSIAVVTPGVPVSIMSLVDPSFVNDPGSPTPPGAVKKLEYTPAAQQIFFQAMKPGAAHGLQNNTGNIYIVRIGAGGAGNRDDYGAIVACLQSGQSFFLASAALNRNVYSPYRYYIDADNAGDCAQCTLIMQ